jgi:hypothetical protein
MQPYIFPYLGYYQLIHHTDKWVVFDDIQFSSKSWVNRNRILHPEKEKDWQYFTVPIKKHSRSIKINELEINNNIAWKKQLLGKLSHYKNKAPYYDDTLELIKEIISPDYSELNTLLVNSLKLSCNYLGIKFDYRLFSEMTFDAESIYTPGDWALNIAKKLNACEYVNPPSGYKIFNEHHFQEKDIKLNFLKSQLPSYVQRRGGFSPGLSIIDIMMWNSISDIRIMLDKYSLNSYSELLSTDDNLKIP